MVNANGAFQLNRDLNSIRNQLSEARRDISFLVKALEAKAPEVLEEFTRLKTQDAEAAAANANMTANFQRGGANPAVMPMRR
jgi:chromosome segregation ATPase